MVGAAGWMMSLAKVMKRFNYTNMQEHGAQNKAGTKLLE